jgi:non-canonical purine NTP pyrophosphatase (RdgB/HAM1 family)
MSTPKEILYVTGNPGKFEEIATYVAEHEPTLCVRQVTVDIPEIQTLDLRAIALDKAQKAWQLVRHPLLIDDAAVYFARYNQFPGTLTKFIWQGLGFEGIKRLFDEGDPARFSLYMVYIEGPQHYEIFEGVCEGTLTKPATFNALPTLPFDAIFIPHGTTKTYVQLRNSPQAPKYLYRLRALQKFLMWYKRQ